MKQNKYCAATVRSLNNRVVEIKGWMVISENVFV